MKLKDKLPFLNGVKLPDALMRNSFFSERPGGASTTGRGAVRIIKLLIILLPAVIAAYIVCMFVDTMLSERALMLQQEFAAVASGRSRGSFSQSIMPRRDLSFAPFNVGNNTAASSASRQQDAKPIDAFTLIGTVPPVAAWIVADGTSSFVMKDQEFGGYVLSSVAADSVIFTLGPDSYTLFLNFSANQPSSAVNRSSAPAPIQPAYSEQRTDVQNADFNGKDGTVSRELLHTLLMNPYEEMGKLRLIPTSSGMIVESMRSDSLLNQLGVRQGDEITGINGISIKDIPSIMNAINSMMSGTRLDFGVTRDSVAGTLGYVVK